MKPTAKKILIGSIIAAAAAGAIVAGGVIIDSNKEDEDAISTIQSHHNSPVEVAVAYGTNPAPDGPYAK